MLLTCILLPSLLACYFAARLYPIWHTRNQGCDAYYFLLCAEQFRKTPRIPIVLPEYFLLEPREQWYPPFFAVFLSFFSENWLKKNHWMLNPLLDSLLFIGLFLAAAILFPIQYALIGALVYAMKAPLVMEFRGLTSRSLGLLLFTLFLFSDFLWVNYFNSFMGLFCAASMGVLLLYTHKLSIQILWFLLPLLSCVFQDIHWLLPFILAYLFSFIIYPNYFLNILRAHIDIVVFWYRNWSLLGAHLVKQSPIYGDNKTTIQYYKADSMKNILHIIRTLIHMNYWVVFIPIAFMQYPAWTALEQFLIWTVVGIYAWAFLTWAVPKLRCFGLGQQYIKYAYIPNLLLVPFVVLQADSAWALTLFLICFVLSIRQYWLTLKMLKTPNNHAQIGHLSVELRGILDSLKAIPAARLLCLPLHLADLVAFYTRKPVLWGTHGFGFKEIEPLFPVLRVRIEEFITRYHLTHCIVDKRYCGLEELKLKNYELIQESGPYSLLQLK